MIKCHSKNINTATLCFVKHWLPLTSEPKYWPFQMACCIKFLKQKSEIWSLMQNQIYRRHLLVLMFCHKHRIRGCFRNRKLTFAKYFLPWTLSKPWMKLVVPFIFFTSRECWKYEMIKRLKVTPRSFRFCP